MNKSLIFDFIEDVSNVSIPQLMNNPFGTDIPKMARIAAQEFQDFITSESQAWAHDFSTQKGKMFGVLVVQKEDNTYGYLGTVSGKLLGGTICTQFIPSVFDDSTDDFYINRGMRELTEIGVEIKQSDTPDDERDLKENRKQKSIALQKWLFEQYRFLNVLGKEKDVMQIFEDSSHANPPAAAGECAAPKLLQYAFEHQLKPITIAEFWWGNPPKNIERMHKSFYPACKNKCRPILEYMLDDRALFEQVESVIKPSKKVNIINESQTHTVPQIPTPIRLQEYGVGIFDAALTKSALKKALKKNLIMVNGDVGTTATMIRGGESINISIPEKVIPKKQLIFPLEVVFEDDYLAVIHKPAGILVSGNGFKTIANALPQNLQPSSLADVTKPQPVHRLDFATTGLLLVGKTSSSIRALNQMFEDKKVAKAYYAVAIGEMNDDGEIASEIDGKSSRSYYQRLEMVTSERFGHLNLLKMNLDTGRRHQLRKHLASIGNPILGDKDYGVEGLILNGKGLYLHAYSLDFNHPFTNEAISFKDDLPQRFKKIFDL